MVHMQLHISGGGQQANRSGPENLQRGGSRQTQDRDLRGFSADRQRQDRSRPVGEDRHRSQGRSRLAGVGQDRLPGQRKNENPVELLGHKENDNQAEKKKIQVKDRNGPTLEQDLSSLLMQQLIQEKQMQLMSQSQHLSEVSKFNPIKMSWILQVGSQCHQE